MKYDEDPISVAPTIDGPHARAWKLDLSLQTRAHSGVAAWLIEAPWAHPFWHSYGLTMIHLRPVPGLGDANIALQGATHELAVYALDPDRPREPIMHGGPTAMMTPCNFAAQIIEASDDAAAERAKRAVDLICQGKLSPDTDYIRAWGAMFGDNLMLDRSDKRSDP